MRLLLTCSTRAVINGENTVSTAAATDARGGILIAVRSSYFTRIAPKYKTCALGYAYGQSSIRVELTE
jgi:hypothetical protein